MTDRDTAGDLRQAARIGTARCGFVSWRKRRKLKGESPNGNLIRLGMKIIAVLATIVFNILAVALRPDELNTEKILDRLAVCFVPAVYVIPPGA
jgi:hypothetical protein